MNDSAQSKQAAWRLVERISAEALPPFNVTIAVAHNVPLRLVNRVGAALLEHCVQRCLAKLEDRLSGSIEPVVIAPEHAFVKAVYRTRGDFSSIKHACVGIEEDGFRLVDLDVYENGQARCRADFGLSPRKCFVCERPAALCTFESTHPDDALASAIQGLLGAP